MKKLVTILFVLGFSSLFGQGEYNNWCFGDYIQLNFSSGLPLQSVSSTVGTNSAATISDKNGNLLFYLNGAEIFNGNHSSLINGINPVPRNTNHIQSVNIVPFPCNDSLFYVFSIINEFIYPNVHLELEYSIINMKANNGQGEVVQKAISVDSNIVGGFGMTRHANNKDYWIIYQMADTNIYHARQISSSGIGPPIISSLGPNKTGWGFYGFGNGTLKFSSDSKHLINCFALDSIMEHYSFDNTTGLLSNNFQLNYPSNITYRYPFASQFSADLSKLYITGRSCLLQFDFSSGNPATISNSAAIIANYPSPSTSGANLNDIALAPNHIIYISRFAGQVLASIDNPNNLGAACNFVNQSFNCNAQTGAGFPTMLPNLFVHRNVLTDSLFCQYDTINLFLSDTNFIDSVAWNFGDPASGALNTSKDVIPLHVFNQYGLYPIEVIVFSGCVSDTINDTIRINPTPIANLGNDTILCEGDSMQLLFNDTSFNYLWSTGDSSMSIKILQADTFSIAISSICGVAYDTIVIDSLIPALVHLPNDTLMCDGDSLFLDASIQSGSYLWSTSDTTPTIWATIQDTFYVSTLNFCGADSDTVVVNFTHAPLFELGADTTLCVGDTLVLNAYDTLSSYLWMNGDTTNFDTITASGLISVTTTNLCGSFSDTIQSWFLSPPTANLGNDTVVCLGDTIALSDTTLFGSYAWSDASVTDTLWVHSAGNYSVTITNLCGADADTILVETDTIPMVDLGNDTVICNGNSVVLNANFSRASFAWSNGSTDSAIIASTQNTYWATATNLCGVGSDTVFVDVDSVLNVDLGADTILCLGTHYTLFSNVIGDHYLWNNGNTSDSMLISYQDTYSLVVTNVCGTFTDSILVFYDNSPITNLGPDSTYCLSSLVDLNAHWSRAKYLWNTADTTSSITANFSGNYSVMVTNLCGYDGDTVNIQYDIPIAFNLGPDTVLCVGDSFLISAPAHNASWLWNDGSLDSTLMVQNAGNFYVAAHNHCGVFSDSIRVASETLPIVNPMVSDTTFCEGNQYVVTVNRNNAASIIWLNGSNAYTQEFISEGFYSYALQNICGSTSDTFQLTIELPADANLGSDTVLCYGDPIVKSFPYSNHTFLWNTGETDSTKTITETGLYGVTIWTPAHCESYDEFEVTHCDAQLFIPNAFTPGNGDELNNTFQIKAVSVYKFHITIYDRWGGQVFESNDINLSWDGASGASGASSASASSAQSSRQAPAGVYSYKIWYNPGLSSGSDNQSIVRYGSVTLVR